MQLLGTFRNIPQLAAVTWTIQQSGKVWAVLWWFAPLTHSENSNPVRGPSVWSLHVPFA